jgi:hypothetical protein
MPPRAKLSAEAAAAKQARLLGALQAKPKVPVAGLAVQEVKPDGDGEAWDMGDVVAAAPAAAKGDAPVVEAAVRGSEAAGSEGQAFGEGEPKKKRRSNPSRELDDVVSRAITQQCQGLLKCCIDVVQIEGLTLRERVRRDIAAKKAETASSGKQGRLSATYWRNLKSQYTAGESLVQMLAVADTTASTSSALIGALEIALRANAATRSSDPLVAALSSATSLNQRELVGLLKNIHKASHIGRMQQDQLYVEVAKCIVRLDCQQALAKELEVFAPLLDQALAAQWSRLCKHAVPVETFLQANLGIIGIVLDKGDLETLRACPKGQWGHVADVVTRVVQTSQLGAQVWGFVAAVVISESFSRDIETAASKLASEKFGREALAEYRRLCEERVESYRRVEGSAARREVKVPYLGVDLAMKCATPQVEVEVRLWGAERQASLGRRGGLELLPHEALCFDDTEVAKLDCLLPEQRLQELRDARSQLWSMIRDGACTCLEDVQALVKRSWPTISSLDRSCRLDAEFVAGAEVAMQRKTEEYLLDCLPSEPGAKHLDETQRIIKSFLTSDAGQWLTHGLRGKCEALLEVLANFARGRGPAEQMKGQVFWRDVLDKLLNFAVAELPDGKTVGGREAIDVWLATARAKHGDSSLQMRDVDWLQRLRYCLSNDEQAELAAFVKGALARLGAASAAAPAPASSSGAGGAKKKRGASGPTGDEEAKAAMLALFG